MRNTTLAALTLLMLVGMVALALQFQQATYAQGGNSLQLYGNVQSDLGRVKIALDGPARPVDVGGDFTIEFWMRANPGDNPASSCVPGGVSWIGGNILLDRDIYGSGDYGDYGLSIAGGRIAFGVTQGSSENTICGSTVVTDGAWHHIAAIRAATGGLAIFVDGRLDGSGDGPSGDVSYRDGRSTSYPNSDPFLVIGAEKHSLPGYGGYRGLIDELRISRVVRYTGPFTPATNPFSTDDSTAALYHFDEGSGTTVGDSSGAAGGPSNGIVQVGGSPAGPAWSTTTPWGEVNPPPPSPEPNTATPKPNPTPDPGLLLTATVLPERNYLPLVKQ